MGEIKNLINEYYSAIESYKEGGPNTRYKSWEWCHQAFLKKKKEYRLLQKAKVVDKKAKEEIIDYLSLHLAFYLASWGMYRGSSYLLQRDYKAHKRAVREILKQKYESLWDYSPTEKTRKKQKT